MVFKKKMDSVEEEVREDFYAMHANFVQDDWDKLECDICGKHLKRTYLQCGRDNDEFGIICRKCFIGK